MENSNILIINFTVEKYINLLCTTQEHCCVQPKLYTIDYCALPFIIFTLKYIVQSDLPSCLHLITFRGVSEEPKTGPRISTLSRSLSALLITTPALCGRRARRKLLPKIRVISASLNQFGVFRLLQSDCSRLIQL